MKRTFLAGIFLAVFGCFAIGTNVVAEEVNTAVTIDGPWNLEFCWDSSSCANTSLDINQFGRFAVFSTGDGASGVGIAVPQIAVLHFKQGCMPNYIARNPTNLYMSGKIKCTDGSGSTGTWSAQRVAVQAIVEEVTSGISSSGVAE